VTSETSFAQYHTSTWRLLAPAIDLYIRKINLQLYEREFPVLKSSVASERRGLINEISFNAFCAISGEAQARNLSDEIFKRAINDARIKISLLEGIQPETITDPKKDEIEDCVEQVRRLRIFFARESKDRKVEVRPKFPGAGIIASSEGDVYFDSSLFEIKAGQRKFRAVDLKQLLTYAALNNSARLRPLSQLGLFNPRMGISFSAMLDDICLEISGCTAAELLPEITRIISSGDISR
jgi:hypothetical protein